MPGPRWERVLVRTALGVLAACGAVVVAWVAFLVWVSSYDGRQDIDITGWAGDQYSIPALTAPRVATGEVCGPDLPCDQAVVADALTLMRFRTQEEARTAAASRDADGYLCGWITTWFEPGALTRAEREAFQGFVADHHVWDDEVDENAVECTTQDWL